MSDYSNHPMEIMAIPQVASLEYKTMAKNYPLLSTLETLIFLTILWCGISIGILIIADEFSPPAIAIGIFLALPLLILVFSYKSAKAQGYVLRENDIIYKYGVFWRKQTGVSFKRIQHIDITHGPLERKFELATIKFFTAGGSMADLKISGLDKRQAENLRAFVLEKTGLINE